MAPAEAKQKYLDLYRTFASNGASESPAWMRERRDLGIAKFDELGFPGAREEAWRFTDFKPITDQSYALVSEAGSVDEAAINAVTLTDEHHRIVFVDGHFMSTLSDVGELPAGVEVGSLAHYAGERPELVEPHLGKHVQMDDNPFAALSTAFMYDGAFVYVGKDVILREPIELLFVSTKKGIITSPRNLIVAERGSEVSFVESYAATIEERYFTNAVTEIVVGENAKVDCYRFQRESDDAHHVATTHSHQARDSRFNSTYITSGAAIGRQNIRAVMDGEGAEGEIRGLYFLSGEQHTDFHTVIDHAKPHCKSFEYLNGILDNRSHAVFTGKIVVREGAQKTDSEQSNNNLLLTETARADSQPQLEIYADDVKCTHGATLGPLDDRSIYYLRSRGLDEPAARRILTYGFAAEILDRIAVEDAREKIDARVRERLGVEA